MKPLVLGVGMPRKLTNTEVETRLLKFGFTLVGTYMSSRTKLEVRCEDCGYIGFQIPSNIFNGHGCTRCTKHERIDNALLDSRLASRSVERVGECTGSLTKILFRCKLDGLEWYATPKDILAGKGCRRCVNKEQVTNASIDFRLSERPIQRISNYLGYRTKTEFRCLSTSCGNEWFADTTSVVTGGRGCPRCTKSSYNDDKDACIYLVALNGLYCGYGKSTVFAKRYADHITSCKKAGTSIEIIKIFNCSGVEASRIERLIMKAFTVINTGISGFKREATDISNVDAVMAFVENELKPPQTIKNNP